MDSGRKNYEVKLGLASFQNIATVPVTSQPFSSTGTKAKLLDREYLSLTVTNRYYYTACVTFSHQS
jgi:hypothetical protein